MINPSLALNFTTAVLDSRVTITRALNTATRVNSSGYIETVNANLPRFDFSPTSVGTCKGLLIEESRINLTLQSSDYTSVSWNKVDTTVTAASGTSPDGTNTATLFTQGSVGNAEVWQSFIVGAGNTVTYSKYVKKGNAQWYMLGIRNGGSTSFAYAFFDLTNGVVGVTSSSGGFATLSGSTIADAGGGWFRVTFTVMIGAAFGTAVFSELSATANGTATPINGGTRYVWGAQAEVGTFPTSYIPTVAASVTRNADVATITGANFSSWWQATKGGATVQVIPSIVSGIRPLVQYDDGTANEIISLRGNTTNPELYIVDGGAPQAQLDAGTIAANTAYSLTGWWNTNDCKARKDAGAVVIDTTATIPTVTQARLGSDGTNYLNGTLATINYYDKFSGQIYTRRKNKAVFSLL